MISDVVIYNTLRKKATEKFEKEKQKKFLTNENKKDIINKLLRKKWQKLTIE